MSGGRLVVAVGLRGVVRDMLDSGEEKGGEVGIGSGDGFVSLPI